MISLITLVFTGGEDNWLLYLSVRTCAICGQ